MPKWVKFAGMWMVSAAVAVALSWVAVSQVRDRVVQPVRVVPSTVVESGDTPTVVVVETTTTSSVTGPTTATQTTTDATAAASTTRVTTTSASSSTTQSSTTSTTSAPAPVTTVTTLPAAGTLSTHTVAGGTVTIRSSPGIVSFVSAIPKPGFTTELRDSGPDRVRVRFSQAEQESEFEARWENGELEISLDD